MSEPTKEREHVLMADLAGSRQRIRDQDEKIASLERQLAEAKSLIEAHRKAWQAALAPAAQTQQGLSEEGILTALEGIDASFVGGFVRCERCGDQEATDDLDMRRDIQDLIAKIKAGRPNPEKQPSPAAAPAQLSALGLLNEARAYLVHTGGLHRDHDALCDRIDAALAGQPAPTEDREALRAADLEVPPWVANLIEGVRDVLVEAGNGVLTEDGKGIVEYLCGDCKRNQKTGAHEEGCIWGMLSASLDEAETARDLALAGSPAQRGQLGKKGDES